MAMTGMDVAQVRALAKQMNSASQEVTQLAQRLTSALQSTTWVGNDKNRFESEWNGQHLKNLTAVSDALKTASQLATQNASEQEQASS